MHCPFDFENVIKDPNPCPETGLHRYGLFLDEVAGNSFWRCDSENDLKSYLSVGEPSDVEVKSRPDLRFPEGGARVMTTNKEYKNKKYKRSFTMIL